MLELAGLALAGLASGVSLRGIVRDSDRVSQVMAAAIVVNLAAYTFSATISGVDSARELARCSRSARSWPPGSPPSA